MKQRSLMTWIQMMPDCDLHHPVLGGAKTAHGLRRVGLHRAGQDDGGNGNGDDDARPEENNPETGLMLKVKPKTKKPSMYKVLLLNDDYTPMDFVIHILEKFFGKNRQEATDIMLHVHRRGVGVCGVFTYEVAETKVNQVMDYARGNEQPLQCTMEKD